MSLDDFWALTETSAEDIERISSNVYNVCSRSWAMKGDSFRVVRGVGSANGYGPSTPAATPTDRMRVLSPEG